MMKLLNQLSFKRVLDINSSANAFNTAILFVSTVDSVLKSCESQEGRDDQEAIPSYLYSVSICIVTGMLGKKTIYTLCDQNGAIIASGKKGKFKKELEYKEKNKLKSDGLDVMRLVQLLIENNHVEKSENEIKIYFGLKKNN